MVLLHGGGQTRQAWHTTAVALCKKGFTVICPDSKGHGLSYWDPEGDYSYPSMSQDLYALLQSPFCYHTKPILAGFSMGGASIMHLALSEDISKLCSGIVLVDVALAIKNNQVGLHMCCCREQFSRELSHRLVVLRRNWF